MNQKKLLAASVAAACLAMTTSALAADYSNHTGTADGTTLAGHLNSTSDAINSTNDTFENNKLTFTATGGLHRRIQYHRHGNGRNLYLE